MKTIMIAAQLFCGAVYGTDLLDGLHHDAFLSPAHTLTDIHPVIVDGSEYLVTAKGALGRFFTRPATYPEGVPHWDGFVFTVTLDGPAI